MKKVEECKFLSGSFVEDRIREAFKKNDYCQLFELGCKYPKEFAVSFTYFKVDADWWGETMKKVEECKFLSGSFVEDRIREAFKKNDYCQLFELGCKYPKEAVQFAPYQTLKTRLKERIKEDMRYQILDRFKVETIEHLPYKYVEELENFINHEYCPSKGRLKERIKEDMRYQILDRFKVETIEHLPYKYVEELENFINHEYCPSKGLVKEIYNLSLFYDSVRLRTGLRLDETSVKGNYKLENFINHEYCPSKGLVKEIYNLSLFYDSVRLRTGLRLDETSVKGNYKRELTFSEDLRRIIDAEF